MAKISESAKKMRLIIDKAIMDHHITRENYDLILNIATEDASIDAQEKALLKVFNQMIEDKEIKLIK